jgi:hypothetical protein
LYSEGRFFAVQFRDGKVYSDQIQNENETMFLAISILHQNNTEEGMFGAGAQPVMPIRARIRRLVNLFRIKQTKGHAVDAAFSAALLYTRSVKK